MKEKKKRSRAVVIWDGFSLIELIVTVAIMAIMLTVLTPALLQYVERARAQRDIAATSELTNAVKIAMTKEEVYDELVKYSASSNVSCYIDEKRESTYESRKTKGAYSHYSFDGGARTKDAVPYYAAGNMHGVTITFIPTPRNKGTAYVIEDGLINRFISPGEKTLVDLPNLCGSIRQVVGHEVSQISNTYRNSEYTVFVNMGGMLDPITAYGQYSGTNLPEEDINHDYEMTEDRVTDDDYVTDDGQPDWNDQGGVLVPIDICYHDRRTIVNAVDPTCGSSGYSGDEKCLDCGALTSSGEEIPALTHSGVTQNQAAATCENDGYSGDLICQWCNEVLEAGKTISKSGHAYDLNDWEWNGNESANASFTCKTCEKKETIEAIMKTNVIDSTCVTDGEITHIATVTFNGKTHNTTKKEVVKALGHTFKSGVTKPTCVERGYTTYTCTRIDCGYSYHDDYVDAIGHSVGNAATCVDDQVCTVCGLVVNDKLGHSYLSIVTDPTCTERGYTTHTCSQCGDSYIDSYVDAKGHTPGTEPTSESPQICTECGEVLVEAIQHRYTSAITQPTCTEQGYTTYTCGDCGDSYVGDYTEAIGHKPGSAATCTEPQLCTVCGTQLVASKGHTIVNGGTVSAHKKCGVCGVVVEDGSKHNYTKNVKSEATCTTAGQCTYACGCGYTYTETTPKTEHKSVFGGTLDVHNKCEICGTVLSAAHNYSPKVTIAATCTTKGTTKYTCACGYSYTDQNVAINSNNHTGTVVNGGTKEVHSKYSCCGATVSSTHTYTTKVTTAATCTTDGAKTHTCLCGYSYVETVKATGHNEVDGDTADAHKKCSECEEVLSTAHNYSAKVTRAATCTAEGIKTYSCECGHSYTEAIAKLSHTAGEAATCTTAQKCTVCGTQLAAAKGHTETNGGTEGAHKKCSVCGVTLSTTHTYKSTISVAATCTTKGTTKYTCDCGYSYTKQDIGINSNNHTGSSVNGGTKEAHTKYSCCGATISSAHNYTNKVTTSATCTTAGVRTYTCDCGYKYTEAIAATGHTSVNGGTKDVHSKCSTCGATLSSTHSYTSKVTKEATCTAEGVKTHTCGCGYSYTESMAKISHTSGTAATCTTAQTCTVCGTQLVAAKGHTEVNGGSEGAHKKCSVCGTILSTTHSYQSTVTIAATCTTKGTTKYTCSCGYSYTKQDVAINTSNHTGSVVNGGTKDVHTKYSCCGATVSNAHSYTNKVTTAATCTTAGVRTYTCACGYSYTESISATGHTSVNGGAANVHTKCSTCGTTLSTAHSYSSSVSVAATCTTKGTTKYTCACGYSYTDQNIAINANNHTGSAVNGATEGVHSKYSCCGATISATHTLTNVSTSSQCRKCACGYIDTSHTSVNGGTSGVHSKCSDCGYTISSTHSYTNSVTTAATCTAAGVRTYKCSCGYSYTEVIAATGHTSTYGGTSSVHTKCSVCGTTLSSSHSYSYSTISYASCTSTGTSRASCACGYSYTYSTGPNGHSSTSGGTSGVHSKCSSCGTTLSSSHSYSSSVTTAATCSSTGVRTYSCSCGYSYTESIAKLDHSPGAAATCTTAQTCTSCGTQLAAKLGHNWNDATCATPKTCSRCQATSGTAPGHSWVAATCTDPKTCSRCGKTSGEKLGHSYSSATCTTLQTCSKCGKTKGELASHSYSDATCTSPKTCTVCGATSGSKLGHSYSAATCTKAKTCSRCGTTSGSALGHNKGAAATCTIAQTCTRCSYVYQAALGHRWTTNTTTNKTTCGRCGLSYET